MPDQEIEHLQRIFSLQERALKKNIQQNSDRYSFVARCIDLIFLSNISLDSWDAIPDHTITVFNYFRLDALSTLINSIRLCLQGCDTDAYALMRIVIENLTVLDYIITSDLFEDAYLELSTKAPRGKKFSSRFSFKTAISQPHVTDRRERLVGNLSNIGAHISPPRLSSSLYRVGYAKIGLSIDNPRIKLSLGELASLSLFFVMVIDDFISKFLEKRSEQFHTIRLDLEKSYDRLASDK